MSYAQSKVVVDMETKEPIVNAAVIIGNTSIGTSTNANGYYHLDISTDVGQVIIFSHLNYQTKKIDINKNYFKKDTIFLAAYSESLAEVSISKKADPGLRKRRLKRFINAFLGEANKRNKVKITNTNRILLYETNNVLGSDIKEPISIVKNLLGYEINNVLSADINEPIRIINNHLGYEIYFYLDEFKLYRNDDLIIKGSAYFKEIETSKKKLAKFKRNRKKLFAKTSRKYFIDLVKNELSSLNYNVGQSELNKEKTFVNYQPIHLDSLNISVVGDSIFTVNLNQYLTVSLADMPVYGKNIRANKGNLATGIKASGDLDYVYPTSYLKSKSNQIILNRIGLILNPLDIEEYGFWAEQRIAQMLPNDYGIK